MFDTIRTINIGIALLWFASALFDYSKFCYIWQLKQYRLDIFRDFLTTQQGKLFLFRYPMLWRSIILIIVSFLPFNDVLLLKYILIGTFLIDLGYNTRTLISRQVQRPSITIKALGIIALSFVLEWGIFLYTKDWALIFVIILLRFVVITAVVMVLQIPTIWTKKFIVFLAKKKLQKYPNMTVVGITGSYGKTSVKEFLSHILGQKYRIAKTEKNINTEIGIAKYILTQDFSDKDIFVCEMGAYRIGEIAVICKMVQPKIGILTAINEQHLSLFGSIQNIQTAKYELLRAIPEDGLVITNADNPYCTEFLSALTCQNIQTFGTEKESEPQCIITDISSGTNGTTYEWQCANQDGIKVHTPVIGAHHAYNITPAMLAARFLHMSEADILNGCKTLPTNIHGSYKIYSYGKATIIDDSYNANPTGFKSALDVLAKFPSDMRRIVITRGMMELGEKSAQIHEEIGGEIAFVADGLVVITKDFFESLFTGVGCKYHTQVALKDNPVDLLSYVKALKQEHVVILLENRIPLMVHNELRGIV